MQTRNLPFFITCQKTIDDFPQKNAPLMTASEYKIGKKFNFISKM